MKRGALILGVLGLWATVGEVALSGLLLFPLGLVILLIVVIALFILWLF